MVLAVGTADASETRQDDVTLHRRRGLFAGLMTLLVAALPLGWALSLTHASFSGCWLTCGGAPSSAEGTLWAIVAAVLLGIPLGVALTTARVRSWVVWGAAALAVLLAVSGWVMFSVDPANADFFVK
jgi:hypothetical protein